MSGHSVILNSKVRHFAPDFKQNGVGIIHESR